MSKPRESGWTQCDHGVLNTVGGGRSSGQKGGRVRRTQLTFAGCETGGGRGHKSRSVGGLGKLEEAGRGRKRGPTEGSSAEITEA